MNKKVKIGIVVALVVLVSAVLAIKQNQNSQSNNITNDSNTVQSEQSDTNNSGLPKLVDLGAGKCIPCKMMKPILEELEKEYKGRLIVQFIDVWENPDAGKEYKIKLIPTQIFFDKDGKELFRHEGFFSKEDILDKWEELGIKFEENK